MLALEALAWLPYQDDTHKSRSVNKFVLLEALEALEPQHLRITSDKVLIRGFEDFEDFLGFEDFPDKVLIRSQSC